MTNKQKELLLSLLEKREETSNLDHPYNILIHSVLNTINYEDLVNEFINDNEVRNSIFSNLEKRIHSCKNPESIYENLKERVENKNEYQKSQRIRKVLELLLTVLEDDYKIDFFNTFFYSNFSNDKKCAIKYINFIKQDIHETLLDEYYSSGNTKFLIPLLKAEYSEILADNIQELWTTELTFYFKKRLIELTAEKYFSKLEFLKEEEYDLYLLSKIISKKISPKKAIKELDKIPPAKRHFSLFNISKEVDFNIIEKEIKKYIS